MNFLFDAQRNVFGICDLGYSSQLGVDESESDFLAGDLLHGSTDQIMGRKASSLSDMQGLAYSAPLLFPGQMLQHKDNTLL